MKRTTLALALLACTDGNPAYEPDMEADAAPDAGIGDAFRWAPTYVDADPTAPDSLVVMPDRDEDGIRDDLDNCPDVANSDQDNTDEDDNGGDACDVCRGRPGDAASHADADDDGQPICAGDCDDHDQSVYREPQGRERCDGKDNDCNGKVDDGVCGGADAGR